MLSVAVNVHSTPPLLADAVLEPKNTAILSPALKVLVKFISPTVVEATIDAGVVGVRFINGATFIKARVLVA